MEITPISATNSDSIQAIANLAKEIWNQHYTPIIGSQQVEYMINNFQSAEAIQNQISEGLEYYLITNNYEPIGYFAIKLKSPSELFLSKLYVLDSKRGQGIGKNCFAFIKERANKLNAKIIYLTVNKYNYNSQKAYEAWGFKRTGETVQDIGNDFVMDDWIYTLELN